MPARLPQPLEIVTRESIKIKEYETKQVVISLEYDAYYIRIAYDVKDVDGKVIRRDEVVLKDEEVDQFAADNPQLYNSVRVMSYELGKAKGKIPPQAGIE